MKLVLGANQSNCAQPATPSHPLETILIACAIIGHMCYWERIVWCRVRAGAGYVSREFFIPPVRKASICAPTVLCRLRASE